MTDASVPARNVHPAGTIGLNSVIARVTRPRANGPSAKPPYPHLQGRRRKSPFAGTGRDIAPTFLGMQPITAAAPATAGLFTGLAMAGFTGLVADSVLPVAIHQRTDATVRQVAAPFRG